MDSNALITATDDDLDPLERQDHEEEAGVEEGEAAAPAEDEDAPVKEEQELVKEIEKVAVPEEAPAKKSSHVIPRHLIEKELTADDLCDPGAL